MTVPAVLIPQRFQYRRRELKANWQNGICVPLPEGNWQFFFELDANSQKVRPYLVTFQPAEALYQFKGNWEYRWLDDDYGWNEIHPCVYECCGETFEEVLDFRDHLYNVHNPKVADVDFPLSSETDRYNSGNGSKTE